jgi:hypothetical protein
MAYARCYSCLVAKIARKRKQLNSIILLRQLFQNIQRGIFAAIVDKKNFIPFVPIALQGRRYTGVCRIHGFLLVITGDYYGNKRGFFHL